MKKIFLCLLFFVLIVPLLSGSAIIVLKVVSPTANIRLSPARESPSLRVVKAGTLLEALEKAGEWYRVNCPPDERGAIQIGYIYAADVADVTTAGAKAEVPQDMPTEDNNLGSREKAASRSGAGIGLRLLGGGSYLRVGHINDGLEGENIYKRDFYTINSGGLYPFHMGPEGGAELYADVSSRFGISLGAGYFQAFKESKIDFIAPSYGNFVDTYKPEIKVIPVTLSLYYRLPLGRFLSLRASAGIGYYQGTVSFRLNRVLNQVLYFDQQFKADTKAWGYQASLGFELHLSGTFALIVEAGGRSAKFKNLDGESVYTYSDTDPGTFKETLWFYNYTTRGKTYPQVEIKGFEPSYSSYSEVQKAVVDLSGVSVKAGLKIKIF